MKSRNRIMIAQSQRLSLSLSLSRAISILKADAMTLSGWLEEQAAANPLLELTPAPAIPAPWLPRWQDALSRQSGGTARVESLAAPEPGLLAHLSAALTGLGLTADRMAVAEALIEALEPSGWLGRPLAQIARDCAVTSDLAADVLAQLQRIEPAGLFARNLAECLRLQALEAEELDPVMEVMLEQLGLVAAGDLKRLAELARCNQDEIALRLRRLRRYDPKPGARFQPGATHIAEPDLVLRDGPHGPGLGLNRSALPSVTLAPQAPRQIPGDREPGEREPGDKNLAEARAVIRLVESRNHSLLRIAAEILRRQPMVARQGLGALTPMTMGEVATALGLHQSTVSRLVQGTSVDTARGVFWLRQMFSPAVRPDGPAAAAMRDAMAQMIAAEDPVAPLTDAGLARALAGAGAPLARRTVAKYRQDLGIPTAAGRKRAIKPPSATQRREKTVAPGADPPSLPQ